MKKLFFAILAFCAVLSTVHAQQTIVIRRPGILTDLAEAAGAIATLPLAVAEGVMIGTAEAAGTLLHGSNRVVVTPAPVVMPAPLVVSTPAVVQVPVAVQPRAIVPAPVVTAPASSVTVTTSASVAAPAAPMTTITTVYRDGRTVSVTREASAYELGGAVIAPVLPEHRVGSSPFVNPYIYRHR